MEDKFGLRVHEKDNVATVFALVIPGETVAVSDKAGKKENLVSKSKIPYGHKIGLVDMEKGEKVFKYGQIIGQTTASIKKGEHVHVQNMDSLRGRGDLTTDKSAEDAHAI